MRCISAACAVLRCLCVCPCVRVSVTFVSCIKTNKDIFIIFSPSGSQAILVFPYQTGWRYFDGNPLTGASNARGYEKITIFDLHRVLFYICILVLTAYLPRNADWSISWSFPYQFAPNSHAVFYWETATLERSQISKNRFLNLEFCRRKTVVLTFLRRVSSKFAAMSEINKWRHGHLSYGHVIRWAAVTWYAY